MEFLAAKELSYSFIEDTSIFQYVIFILLHNNKTESVRAHSYESYSIAANFLFLH